jgi:hypothetical protein
MSPLPPPPQPPNVLLNLLMIIAQGVGLASQFAGLATRFAGLATQFAGLAVPGAGLDVGVSISLALLSPLSQVEYIFW